MGKVRSDFLLYDRNGKIFLFFSTVWIGGTLFGILGEVWLVFLDLVIFNAIFWSRERSTGRIEVWDWIGFDMEILLWFFGIEEVFWVRWTCIVFEGRGMMIFVFLVWRSKLVYCWSVLWWNDDVKDGRGIGNRLDGEFFLFCCKVVLVGFLSCSRRVLEERFLRKGLFFRNCLFVIRNYYCFSNIYIPI